jgi:thioredoxin reductase (NADPH)
MSNDDLYDVVVVGAGAAGLTAAIMLSRSMRRTLMISKRNRRNSSAITVNNVPYADGASPGEIYEKMERDALRSGVSVVWDEVTTAKTLGDHVAVEGRQTGRWRGRRLLLATGRIDILPRWLPDGLWGKSVFDCPYCHTYERRDGRFVCVGKGEETLKMAALARQLASQMTVLVSEAQASSSRLARLLDGYGVEVLPGEVVKATSIPDGSISLYTQDGRSFTADTLLLGDTVRPCRALADELDLYVTDEGFPETTLYGMTSDPLVYSAGNVEGSPYFIWTGAASSGINAARAICEDLAFGHALLEE